MTHKTQDDNRIQRGWDQKTDNDKAFSSSAHADKKNTQSTINVFIYKNKVWKFIDEVFDFRQKWKKEKNIKMKEWMFFGYLWW